MLFNTTQQRGLLVAFALCLVFTLTESRRAWLPGRADAVLAVLAAVSGSYICWNHGNLAGASVVNPSLLSLTMASLGLALLVLASGRLFGWFAALLVTMLVFQGPIIGAFQWVKPFGFEYTLAQYWLTSEGVFGLMLGIFAQEGFGFVILGAGFDVLGLNRPVVSIVARHLPPEELQEPALTHPLTNCIWALALLFFYFLQPDFWDVRAASALDMATSPLLLGVLLYLAFMAVAWLARLSGKEGVRRSGWGMGEGGMLLSASLILSGILIACFVAAQAAFADLTLGTTRIFQPADWLALFSAVSLAITLVLLRRPEGRRQWAAPAVLAFFPVALLFWLMAVERYSPSLSAFFANILLLFIMAEHCYLALRRERLSPVAVPGAFVKRAFLPLCESAARIMVRVVIIFAALGMLVPWSWVWSGSLEYLVYWLSGGT